MIERTLWHPVAEAAALPPAPGAGPLAVRLLGEDLVLWRDAAGTAQAFADRCPHRGARLSLGRVTAEGTLECAYHGWQFAGADGHCVAIPALPGFSPPAGHAACRHAVQEAHGLLWVRLAGEGDDPGLPVTGFSAEAPGRRLVCGPYDVASSGPRIVENFLDVSHFGFVHEGGLGDRAHTGIARYEVEERRDGLAITGVRVWQPQATQALQGAGAGAWVDYRYELLAPYTAALHKLPETPDGGRDSIALLVCPRDEESCRVWFFFATTNDAASDESLAAFQDDIFRQDQPVLESQRPKRLPLAGEKHCAADRASVGYRRWLLANGVTFGVC